MTPSNAKTVFTNSLVLAWLITCLLIFVYVSRIDFVQIVTVPNWASLTYALARISPFRYILDLLGALLGVTLFSLACLSLGLGILKKVAQLDAPRLATGITAFLIGEILYSILFLTVISLYRLPPELVVAILSLGFLLGFPALKTFLRGLGSRPDLSSFQGRERIILLLGALALILGLLLSSTRLGYDATAEYFSHAKIMAVTHLPTFFYPKDYFVVSSFHPGILFTALIQLFGDQSARLLPWVNGMAILLMGLAIGQELGLSARARLWFLTLAVTSTMFVDLLGDGKIELISTAPIVGAVYWLLRSAGQPAKGIFILVGFLSAFAIISRPYNIFLVGLFVALFLISRVLLHHRTGRFEIRQPALFMLWIALPLFALGTFHLFQNWLWLGDPIAPLMYAQGLDTQDWQWQLDPANLTVYRLFYPIVLTFLNSPQSMGNISPLLIGVLPFLILSRVRKNVQISAPLRHLSLVASLTLLIWITFYFTVLEIRYVLFLWLILFLTMALVLESVTRHVGMPIRSLIEYSVIIFLIVLCVRTMMVALSTYLPGSNVRPADCADTYLCAFVDIVNQRAAPGERVFVLHAYRYYLRSDLFACSSQVGDYFALEPLARQNSPEFWSELYRHGYRYIMYEEHLAERRYNFGPIPDLNTVPGWLQIKVLYSSRDADQMIYQLEARDPPILPEISCRQDSGGSWHMAPAVATQP